MAEKKDIDFGTYIERDLTKSVIDWNTISKTLTDDLTKLQEERKKQRAEIEKNTIEADNTLNTLEQYDNADLGSLALGMSEQSAKFLQTQNNLFKRGLITQTEFAQAKQKVLSDWKSFSNVSKQWNDDYKNYVERIQKGEASNLEKWLNEQNVAFGNLENIQGYVNPQTGRLSLVEVDPNTGQPSDDPGKHVSMNTINTRFKTKYDRIDPTELVKGKVDELGALLMETLGGRQEVYGQKGWGTMRDDADFQAQMRDQAKSLLSDDTVATLAGSPSIGAKYVYAGTPEADAITAETDDVVLMKIVNGRPVLDDEAANIDTVKQKVEDLLYGNMMIQLDQEYSVEKGFEVTSKLADERVRGNIESQAYRDELASKELNLKERRFKLDQEVAAGNITAQQAATQLARDKYELDVLKYETNDELVNSQIDQIYANIDLNRDKFDLAKLTGDRNYKIALMNETYKSKLLKEKEEEGVVPFTYPDPNKVRTIDGKEQTANEFADDFAMSTGIRKRFNLENNNDNKRFLAQYVQGMLDPNVYNQLAEAGGFDVQFEPEDKSERKPGLNTKGNYVLTIGGKDYTYPPKEASEFDIDQLMKESGASREDAINQLNEASGYNAFKEKFSIKGAVGSYALGKFKIDDVLQHLNKFILDPVTTGAIALQEKPEEDNVNYIDEIMNTETTVVEGDAIFEVEEDIVE